MDIKERIKASSEQLFPEVSKIRRHLHMHPELSFQEEKTARYVAERLEEAGITYKNNVAGHGLVATIEGKEPSSRLVMLRADMDALPIYEANQVEYKSKVEGVMHACGHDVHTSCLLGAAMIFQKLKSEFQGTVKMIFQPGEEKIPGGASLMISEGVLNPVPQAIIGQHVMPHIPVGKVGFKKGMYMASADEIYVTVRGRGGHAAMPDSNIDPVLIASHIIVALQQVVSRHASPRIPTVLSFGKVLAEGATNIIPDEVKIEGTFRTLNEEWRQKAHGIMKKMAESIAEGMGGECDFQIMRGYPFLKNHEELTGRAIRYAQDYLGPENVEELDIWLAAEDFAYYSQIADACFYRLGVRNEATGITSNVHTPTFDIDEQALKIGAGLISWIAYQELVNQ